MQTKFTSGPWRVAQAYTEHGMTGNSGSVPIMSEEDGGTHVCDVHMQAAHKRGKVSGIEDPERDANLALIAAAPDLLEALRRVDHTLQTHGHMDCATELHNFLLRAILKAVGE
jgi:phosphoribosyl 1,2-cyclic phosphodiesterase